MLKGINDRMNECIRNDHDKDGNFFNQEDEQSRDQTLICKFIGKKKKMSLSYYKENCTKISKMC